MNKLYKSLEKLPDSTKEVYFFDKNGEKHTKTVKVSDRYLLTNNNGNSIAVTKDYLKQIGINVEEEKTILLQNLKILMMKMKQMVQIYLQIQIME